MRGKHDVNPIFLGLCPLILLFALVDGGRANARCNWIFFIPIFILYIYSVFFCESDRPVSDYTLNTLFMPLIPTASDYILLRPHQRELRKIGQKKTTSEMTFTERLAWASSLLATPRGIGWAHEPTAHLPPRPIASRGKFIASQLLWILFYTILYDIALTHLQSPCYWTGGPSFTAFGWWQWQMRVWVQIVTIYCSMSGMYATLSIISVATGLHEPRDWPHHFGSLWDAYTVRKCWGYVLTTFHFHAILTKPNSRVWHQALRRELSSNADFLARAFRVPRGKFMTYFKLFTSFFISGLIHAAADYTLHQNFSGGGSMQFFVLQAVAITFEDAIIGIASRLGYNLRNPKRSG